MQYPKKGSFWDQPTDGAMYKYLLVRLIIGIGIGVLAWVIGHFILRQIVVAHLTIPH